jgi:hypothetical protein
MQSGSHFVVVNWDRGMVALWDFFHCVENRRKIGTYRLWS